MQSNSEDHIDEDNCITLKRILKKMAIRCQQNKMFHFLHIKQC
ncbi:unnamed protein product [Paramecium octaurelia]|uniref:Uncharacterized protein n=1 Tax=Paramecium octaurelia TaxID=43137 RepID=A0A8S1TVI9_PAROT|nr:unnamed protein product [Paramecium octaurelia]